ncbi:DMT family transporter [Rhodobacter calidifons]|uniref:DMT family transporter n=1 Tax=Rhodobacter calidifons TaxID=2715277 RepID=A0ABX0G557_9RHOB|nr:DMT family transporter [Rhodobacter calidifons]NHB76340.1 DMT family transporter [Rhodobacter calidifons]
MSPTGKGLLLGLGGFGLFSVADATIKHLGGAYHAVQIVAFAGLFTLPLIGLIWLRTRAPLRPAHPWLMAVRSLALVGNGLLVTYVFTAIPLAEAYAIFFTLPLVLTLMAWPLLGDRVDAVGALAVVVGLIGVMVALNPGRVAFGIGHLAAVAGMVLAAVHYLIVRKVGGVEAPVAMLLYPVLAQTVSAFLLLPGRYQPMPLADLATVAGVSVTAMVGTLLMFAAYRAAPPVVVAPTQYSQIAFAALFGALFFDEPMSPAIAIGMAIIAVAGLLVIARQDRPHPAALADPQRG